MRPTITLITLLLIATEFIACGVREERTRIKVGNNGQIKSKTSEKGTSSADQHEDLKKVEDDFLSRQFEGSLPGHIKIVAPEITKPDDRSLIHSKGVELVHSSGRNKYGKMVEAPETLTGLVASRKKQFEFEKSQEWLNIQCDTKELTENYPNFFNKKNKQSLSHLEEVTYDEAVKASQKGKDKSNMTTWNFHTVFVCGDIDLSTELKGFIRITSGKLILDNANLSYSRKKRGAKILLIKTNSVLYSGKNQISLIGTNEQRSPDLHLYVGQSILPRKGEGFLTIQSIGSDYIPPTPLDKNVESSEH